MPNGGPTPDCVHCIWYDLHLWKTKHVYRCQRHNLTLHIPIRNFCADFTDIEYGDEWLDEKLNRNDLREQIMYIWLELIVKQDDQSQHRFIPELLASFEEYTRWTEEQFWDKVIALRQQKAQHLKAQGYEVDLNTD